MWCYVFCLQMSVPGAPSKLWAELEALPPGVRGEIIKGVLHTQPQPFANHQNIIGAISSDLINAYQRGRWGPGGWFVVIGPGVRLMPGEEFVPDIAAWRKERLPRVADRPIPLAPEWVCEVQSRSTRRFDLQIKRSFYAEIGVQWLWYVDPDGRTFAVSRLERGRWVDMGIWTRGDRVKAPPFPAVELDTAEWWGDEW